MALVRRKVTVPSQNTARWKALHLLDVGQYRVTLVGTGLDPIKTDKGNPLDGDPTQLPSGDGCPGGDFTFEFKVEKPKG